MKDSITTILTGSIGAGAVSGTEQLISNPNLSHTLQIIIGVITIVKLFSPEIKAWINRQK